MEENYFRRAAVFACLILDIKRLQPALWRDGSAVPVLYKQHGEKSGCNEQRGVGKQRVVSYMPVSYTHLDVYTRQDQINADGSDAGNDHQPVEEPQKIYRIPVMGQPLKCILKISRKNQR